MNNYFLELHKSYLIAEIGVNHNGSIPLAKEMILAAKQAGADAVKFQTFSADLLVGNGTPKVAYQKKTTSSDESHYEMIKSLELKETEFEELFDYCNRMNIDFLSTPYDIGSVNFLDGLGVSMFKTASADIVDVGLHEAIAKTGKPSIIATGMATLGEIEQVIEIYERIGNEDIVLLHCVSNYPCSDESINLKSMCTLGASFDMPIGYSDHSIGFLAAVLSVAYGAKVIEKHFTLDKNYPGPDHKASSTPDEFKELVDNVRRAEKILGSKRKRKQKEESQMADVSRKSVVYNNNLEKGHVLEFNDLSVMRPGSGFSPAMLPQLVGKRLTKKVFAKNQVQWSELAND